MLPQLRALEVQAADKPSGGAKRAWMKRRRITTAIGRRPPERISRRVGRLVVSSGEKTLWRNLFIQNGADLNVRDMSGETVLMFLSRKRIFNSDFLEVLVRNEADSSFINAQDRYGRTALMMLAYFGNLTPELLETFIQNGADIDSQDVWGRTPLIVLSEKGFLTPELLKVFGSNGADVDIQDDCSDREGGCGTAIMHVHAAGYLSPLLTKMFIDFGASLDISTTEEWNDDNEDTSFYVNAVFYINAAESLVNAFSWILDTDPQWVVNFFKDKPRLGKSMLEKWTKMNVPGTTRLVAKLVEYAKTGEAHKESCSSFSPVMEF